MTLQASGPRYVYEFFDANGDALYVGCTMYAGDRIANHEQRPWWGEVVRIEVTRHPDSASGLAAEAERIKALDPKHNIVHTDRHAGQWTLRKLEREDSHRRGEACDRRWRCRQCRDGIGESA